MTLFRAWWGGPIERHACRTGIRNPDKYRPPWSKRPSPWSITSRRRWTRICWPRKFAICGRWSGSRPRCGSKNTRNRYTTQNIETRYRRTSVLCRSWWAYRKIGKVLDGPLYLYFMTKIFYFFFFFVIASVMVIKNSY